MQPAEQLIILGGTSSASGGGSLPAPAAATLTLTSGATDNQPDFLITGDILIGDTVTVRAFSDAGKTILIDTGQGVASADGTVTVSNQLGPFSDGSYWYDEITTRSGHFDSDPSNTENNTIDTTAPTLSSPTGTKTGSTTAALSVSTNEGNGTLYWVVDTNTSTPSAAQVKLGKDQGGNAADDSGSQAVVATGVQTISGGAAGLTGSTTYKAFYMHEDAVGNQSTVSAQSGTFTTDAPSSTTWNPSDKSANITLSNGDLTASQGGGSDGVFSLRAIASASSGKKYWELHVDGLVDVGAQAAGFGNSSQSLTGIFGTSSNSAGWITDGRILLNNSTAATVEAWSNGSTLCLAVDFDNMRAWFRKNGGNWNNDVSANPATNTNGIDISGLAAGPYFAAATLFTHGFDALTANFGATSYAQSAPSGFGNW